MTQVNHLVQSGAEKVVGRHLFLSNSLRFQDFGVIFLRDLGSRFWLEFTHSCGFERFCRADYVTGVRVVVSEASGTKVLEVESAGPYLLAKLPEGNYRISVIYDGQAQQQDFVAQAGRAQEFVFRW